MQVTLDSLFMCPARNATLASPPVGMAVFFSVFNHVSSFNKAYWGSTFEYCVHDVRGGVFCDVAGGSLTHVPVWRVLYVRFVTGPISRIFSSPTCSSWLGRRSQRTNRH